MEGVILFADDKVLTYSVGGDPSQSEENKLYRLLAQTSPVLGLMDRDQIQTTINTVGSFAAMILDWQYDDEDLIEQEEEDDETVRLVEKTAQKDDKTFELLMSNNLYSLIYIYSTAKEEIEAKYGEKLREKFKGRIVFRDKSNLANTEDEAQQILNAIAEWKKENKKLDIPITWGQSINRSVQDIFSQLQLADPEWIKELYETARIDGVTPSLEVINLFQNVLSEKIIQDTILKEKIDEIGNSDAQLSDAEQYARLIRILYYGYVSEEDPIMTGDIIKISEDKYGIIITPECDIRHVSADPDNSYEILCFNKGDYKRTDFRLNANINPNPLIARTEQLKNVVYTNEEKAQLKSELKAQIEKAELKLQITAFTQTNQPRKHLLPCFEFSKDDCSGVALIDFRTGLDLIQNKIIKPSMRIAKLNTPYIQELRQRYLAYKGRVGVAGYSEKLRHWLISKN